MKRFVAFAIVGSFPLIASAGPPVSVHPPASLNQPLSAAVQAAGANLPPAPVMSSQPTNWGGSPCPSPAVPCGEPACGGTKPYFNVLAPRGGTAVRGSCLDRLKEWATYNPEPCKLGRTPTPYQAPLRTYFTCRPTDGSPGVGCGGAGGGTAGCATGRGGCGTVALPVTPLTTNACDAPTCRPRVRYQPLSCRAEVPTGTPRPRLLDRLFGLFGPKCDAGYGDDWCAPAPTPYPAGLLPATPIGPAMPPPSASVLPMTTAPLYTPPAGKVNGKTVQLTPLQPFTNP